MPPMTLGEEPLMPAVEFTPGAVIRQMIAYDEMLEMLEAEYSGRWVVIHDCQLVGDYGSYGEAEAAAMQENRNILDCFIQRVGVEPPIIISYGG